jgi:nicotinamide-nucleotide amidase
VIYGEGSENLQSVVARLLVERGMTLCVVDSVTGGEIARRLRSDQHSEVLVGDQHYPDAVSAADGLRLETSGLNDRSRDIVERAAARAREDAGASLGLAVLGMLSQASGMPMAYLSLSDNHGVVSRAFRFGGEDDLTRSWITIRGLDMVRRYLLDILAGWESETA